MAIDEAALAGEGAHIVANLPYNVGTALLVRWLGGERWPPWWASLTLMFQQEVAQRIVAAPGTGAYGRLAILAQWRSEAKLAMKVHRSALLIRTTMSPAKLSRVLTSASAQPKAIPISRGCERTVWVAFSSQCT